MTDAHPPINDNDKDAGKDNSDGLGFGTILVIAGLIVLVAWFAATTLMHFGGVQDCVMQAHKGCVSVK